MSWDRKKRGASSGYYYESQRVAGKPHPVKVYRGRGTAGHLAAVLVDARKRERQAARDAGRTDAAIVAADEMAAELLDWAEVLAAAWLVATGHHNHKGCWRRRKRD